MFFNNTNGSNQAKAAAKAIVDDLALMQNLASKPVPTAPEAPVPDPQVVPKATRWQFSATYKRAILAEADACHEPGQIGALLRREGLYSSTLAPFRKQRSLGRLQTKTDQETREQRREKLSTKQRDRRRLAALEQENQKLRLIIEVQKNLSTILEISLETPELLVLREGAHEGIE